MIRQKKERKLAAHDEMAAALEAAQVFIFGLVGNDTDLSRKVASALAKAKAGA